MNNRRSWETEAENWLRWARTPGHDAYWYYRDAFFDRIVPPAGCVTLEVGCGEGRVTRDLWARGHRVISMDGSITLLRHATELDEIRRYTVADASALPIASNSVDIAIAYNSLMDFDDLPRAVTEVARVLRVHAAFCICVAHPIFDAGSFEGDGADASYRVRAQYFGAQALEEAVTKRGITMRFRGWSHSLEEYISALCDAGFVIDALREPTPDGTSEEYERWERYPMFLHLRAIKIRDLGHTA